MVEVKTGVTVRVGVISRAHGRTVADDATGIEGEITAICADGSEALVDDRVWVPIHRLTAA